jgi:uncharacterized protein YdaU (DUF1376 family)
VSLDWFPWYATDFRRDTYHLSAGADGIYRRLIDEYMVSGKPLPDSDASLAAIARVSADEWSANREVVRAFFKPRDGRLVHKRCEQELHAQRMRAASRSRIAKEAATVRWAKEKLNQSPKCFVHPGGNAGAMRPPATLHNKSISLTSVEVGERGTSEKLTASTELVASINRKASA